MKLSTLPFYHTLTASGRSILEQHLKPLSCSKGQLIHGSGEDAYGMIYVEEGTLSVVLPSEDGREVSLFRLRKGEFCFLTASPSITGLSFDIMIEAESDAKLLGLPNSSLEHMMKKQDAFSAFVRESIAESFSRTVRLLEKILFCTFDQRLAIYLYEETLSTGSLTLHLTHEQIARHIGSAREVVSRALKRFSSLGIVSVSRGCIKILDKTALKRASR